jgi:hypothetical protein
MQAALREESFISGSLVGRTSAKAVAETLKPIVAKISATVRTSINALRVVTIVRASWCFPSSETLKGRERGRYRRILPIQSSEAASNYGRLRRKADPQTAVLTPRTQIRRVPR